MTSPASPTEELNALATEIHSAVEITPFSQIRERLQIISTWFGSISTARAALNDSLVLELGCGQGDMTATIAGLVPSSHKMKILAIDPGALDYGSPITLGEAQAHMSQSKLGGKMEWIQAESLDFITKLKTERRIPDYVILAHSLFYIPSEGYLLDLLVALKDLSASSGKRMKVLLAEWGMCATCPEAEPHVEAVKMQAKMEIEDGNIRTLFTPDGIRRMAEEAGWGLEREGWIVPEEDVDDGCWEVATAKVMEKEGWRDEVKELEEMEKAAGDRVRSMDVWAGVWN